MPQYRQQEVLENRPLAISVSDLLQAYEALPRKAGRSAFSRWMMENRHEFSEHVARRANWSALALAFGRFGLLDRNRKMPIGVTCRQTWWRVRKDAARLYGDGRSESEALGVAEQPDGLFGRRAKRRARDAARKAERHARANAAAKLAAPREPPASVRVVEQPSAKPVQTDDMADFLVKMDKGYEWIKPSQRP
jgi:hypothetical protein